MPPALTLWLNAGYALPSCFSQVLCPMFKKPYQRPERVYAGIGNRDTPQAFLQLIQAIAQRLSKNNYFMRTGAAPGADQAFMAGTMKGELYIPWNNYEGFPQKYAIPRIAEQTAQTYCPAWDKMSKGVRALHARNMMIIAGPHMEDPVDFVVCFTRDGCNSKAMRSPETGGTGSAIAYADDLGVPIINLANGRSLEYLTIFSGVDFMDMELPSLLPSF